MKKRRGRGERSWIPRAPSKQTGRKEGGVANLTCFWTWSCSSRVGSFFFVQGGEKWISASVVHTMRRGEMEVKEGCCRGLFILLQEMPWVWREMKEVVGGELRASCFWWCSCCFFVHVLQSFREGKCQSECLSACVSSLALPFPSLPFCLPFLSLFVSVWEIECECSAQRQQQISSGPFFYYLLCSQLPCSSNGPSLVF